MLDLSKRLIQIILLASMLAVVSTSSAREGRKPDGYLDINAQQVLIGIGYGWGKGVLKFQGQRHPVKIGGFQLVGVGYTSSALTGNVYNLQNPKDIEGTYGVATIGGTAVKGATAVTTLQNKRTKVFIDIWSTTKGLSFNIGGGGFKVQLLDE